MRGVKMLLIELMILVMIAGFLTKSLASVLRENKELNPPKEPDPPKEMVFDSEEAFDQWLQQLQAEQDQAAQVRE